MIDKIKISNIFCLQTIIENKARSKYSLVFFILKLGKIVIVKEEKPFDIEGFFDFINS